MPCWVGTKTDHPPPKKSNDGLFRERLAEEHEIFRIHRDLAKAIKHGVLVYGSPMVKSVDSLKSTYRGGGFGPIASGPIGSGPIYELAVTLSDGEEMNLAFAVGRTMSRVRDLVGLVDHYLDKPAEY